MDFDDAKEKSKVSALYLEKAMLELIRKYQTEHRGAKKGGVINKGFYYYFLRNRSMLGYSLGSGTYTDNFDKILDDKDKFNLLLKAWSAKFSRYIKGSESAIGKLEQKNEIIEEITLVNQLSLCDFFVLTEGLSDKQLLEILRGKEHIEKMIESLKKENVINKRIYDIDLSDNDS